MDITQLFKWPKKKESILSTKFSEKEKEVIAKFLKMQIITIMAASDADIAKPLLKLFREQGSDFVAPDDALIAIAKEQSEVLVPYLESLIINVLPVV